MPTLTKSHNPSSVWAVPETFHAIYSHATEVQEATRLLYISGQFGMPAFGQLPETFESQVHIAMDNVEALLRSAGMDRRNIVKLNYYYVRASDAPQLADIRRERWGSSEAPAVTAIVVSALARPEYLIEIEAIAAAQA